MDGRPTRHCSIISQFAVGLRTALKRMLHESALRYSGRLLSSDGRPVSSGNAADVVAGGWLLLAWSP